MSYLKLWCQSCFVERNHYEEHFCEIILNLDQGFRRCRLNFSYLELLTHREQNTSPCECLHKLLTSQVSFFSDVDAFKDADGPRTVIVFFHRPHL